ncbi:hypothetical protein L204_102045 [Cryptococcus depauperatus]
MKVAKLGNMLPVTIFLVSTVFLPALVVADPSSLSMTPVLAARHGEEHGDMAMGDPLEPSENVDVDGIGEMLPSAFGSATTMPAPHSPHPHADHPPDPHAHGSHMAAMEMLNDTEIHRLHHFPPTFLDADFRIDRESAIFGEDLADWDLEQIESHRGLILTHAVLMGLAYFGLLPISLALRAADHASHHLVNGVFLAVAILGWLAGATYKANMPNYYQGAIYPIFVNILLFTSIALTVYDSFWFIRRVTAFFKKRDHTWKGFVNNVLHSARSPIDEKWPAVPYEMTGLVGNNSQDDVGRGGEHENHVIFAIGDDEENERQHTIEPEHIEDGEQHRFSEHEVSRTLLKGTKPHRPSLMIRQYSSPSRTSTGSEGTLQDTPHSSSFPHNYKASQPGHFDVHSYLSTHQETEEEHQDDAVYQSVKAGGFLRAIEITLTWVRRSQIIFAYVTMIAGLVTYTGMCRADLIHSCAAHYIKGSIFFWYGVLTFGRYLGAYADLGWAWNKRSSKNIFSAEMIECAVIFTYGITNTWMERFGAAPNSPYTVKQVQHISIAVMFWFAGLTGMLLESRWVKGVLASVMSGGKSKEPTTYAFSFNPLPALTIGVTGLAMAAHHQTYVFQVQIHSLWGILLAGGSLFRCLTYFFLYVSSPIHSSLPSRPPTEILTSFGWAAGGIVFMLSNEEIVWSAMRAGWDDMMAFLNFTIALVCFVFCWCVVIMAVKGFAVMRRRRREERQWGVRV